MTSLSQATKRIGLIIVGMILLCGGVGAVATLMLRSSIDEQKAISGLLRNHMTADMMHDAVRGDVLAVIAASDPVSGLDGNAARRELGERLARFREAVAQTRAYQDSAAVSAAASAVNVPLTEYESSAKEIAAVAGTDPAAAARALPAFFERFEQLEVGMESVTDAIEEYAKSRVAYADRLGVVALLLVLATMAGAVAVAVRIGRSVRLELVEPLLGLNITLERMASGDRELVIPSTERSDEVGALARGLSGFREQLETGEQDKQNQASLIVESIGAGLGALAAGDLTASVTAELAPPFARLKADFNHAMDSLRDVIGGVTQSSQALRTGSKEIAVASRELARRTECNAASLEQTSSALTEIEGRLKGTARAAAETVAKADEGIATVQRGRQTTDGAVAAMGRVADSARGIDSVIEGLDKIAFQTRVLAMNAAVEAGRAGESGRGFAVVADLVSALAMRAEEEAKRARGQLSLTQSEIEVAVDAVRSVDGALGDISASVGQVHQLIAAIAADNEAQSSTITQISAAIDSMDKATQQNAAMVEESTAAAQVLSDEAERLAASAARFRIDETLHAQREFAVVDPASYLERPRQSLAA